MTKIDGNSSSADISQVISDTEQELKETIQARGVVQEKIHLISREILEKEINKKDLSIALSRARDNVRTLELDIAILKSKFWSARNSGL